MSENLDQIVQGKAQKWLDGNYDSKTKDQVKYLMENDKKQLTESSTKIWNSAQAACAASWGSAPTA